MRTGKISVATLTSVLALGLLALGAAGALAANPGNPAQFNATATVTILEPITISETRAMSFGKVVGPIGASASNTYTSSGSVTGSGGGSIISGNQNASILYSGSASSTIQIASVPGTCSDSAVVIINPNFDVPRTLSSIGTSLTTVGGRITITNAADGTGPLGIVNCSYTLTAKYL